MHMVYEVELDTEDAMVNLRVEEEIIWYNKLGQLYNELDLLIFTLEAYEKTD